MRKISNSSYVRPHQRIYGGQFANRSERLNSKAGDTLRVRSSGTPAFVKKAEALCYYVSRKNTKVTWSITKASWRFGIVALVTGCIGAYVAFLNIAATVQEARAASIFLVGGILAAAVGLVMQYQSTWSPMQVL